MADQNVKLYGGPAHGKFAKFKGIRLEVVPITRLPPRCLYQEQEVSITEVRRQEVSYYKEVYRESGIRPRRRREITVGILEGANLLPREKYELERSIEQQPWEFPEVDFLKEFDEWFSQAVYRHTGELRWKLERVYY